jgi:hypothetical protein
VSLGQVSCLGEGKLKLRALNLAELFSGNSLTINTKVSSNQNSVILKALADTGADVYTLIDTETFLLLKPFGVTTERLPEGIPVAGFNGKRAPSITHVTYLTLTVGKRRQVKIPFLITPLGRYDVILGRLWFEEAGALVDCRNRRILWPDEPTLKDEAMSSLNRVIPKSILKRPTPQKQHQKDADRRDKLIEAQGRRVHRGGRPRG